MAEQTLYFPLAFLMDETEKGSHRFWFFGPLEHLTDIDSIISGKFLSYELLNIAIVLDVFDLVDLDDCIAARNQEKLDVCLGKTLQIIEVEQLKQEGDLVAIFDVAGKHDQSREKLKAVDKQIVVCIEALEYFLVPSEELDELLIVDGVGFGNALEKSIELLDLGEGVTGKEVIDVGFLDAFKWL